ncbi:methyltransferase domain-containing protein [Longimicrobium terrae]|uniref:SAM-dependent methyltransferase n=1 Tax=Longimicrobium terrae TaxID=1639882 RepID=A0A841H639_9BACT|nr:SAM-dependent methyltransferase [Longimicrobium terrae]MBB6073336.1 SAM-dependent methyltransferase [Longimicrobium terrae]
MSDDRNATTRFSDRVDAYVKYRPGYPEAVMAVLRDKAGLQPGATVADIGAGTGISARMLLESGHTVIGVEPNAAMRAAAEAALGGDPRFTIVAGTAEATGLPDASVDAAVAFQAFHWFHPERARAEWRRILRPDGLAVIIWNARRRDTSDFLRGYDELLLRHGTDYAGVNHENVTDDTLRAFFGGPFTRRTAQNRQVFDYAGLEGRLVSSSYAPNAGQPGYEAMIADLRTLFDATQRDGQVVMEYETQILFARL